MHKLEGWITPTIRRRWPRPAKRCQITIRTSTINNRVGVCTCPLCRFRIAECDLNSPCKSTPKETQSSFITVGHQRMGKFNLSSTKLLKSSIPKYNSSNKLLESSIRKDAKKAQTRNTHKTIAFRSPSVLIGDDDRLKDFPKPLKVVAQRLALRLPRQATHKDLGVGRVPKRRIQELEPGIRTRSRSRTRSRNRMKSHGFPMKRILIEKTQMADSIKSMWNSRYIRWCCDRPRKP